MAAQQLHASFPNSFFPGFFPNTWQLPDFLSSAPILRWLLLLHQTHTHSYTSLSGGEEGACKTFSSVLLPSGFAQERPREFYFQFSNSIFGVQVRVGFFLSISPLPVTSFPHVLHLLFREGFPMQLCSSSSIAGFLYQGRRWQSFTPLSRLLSLLEFHPCCPAHWGFERAHSEVAWYDWCQK